MAISSRAELLFMMKSSSRGESCPVTTGSAEVLEDTDSSHKTTMNHLGQVTYFLPLVFFPATWGK